MNEITYNMLRKWKSVDTEITRKIAHKCTSGVTFATSSKSDIIDSIKRTQNGYTKNLKKFIFMMNCASDQVTNIKEEYNVAIGCMITESISLFEKSTKSEIKICQECAQTYDDCDCYEEDGTPIR